MYIDFSTSEIARAADMDIAELLMAEGEAVRKEGSWYAWMDGTEKVSIKGNTWFHQYERKGGNAIDFVKRFMNKTFPEAVQYLLGNGVGQLVTHSPKTKSPFVLPPKDKYMTAVRNYLESVRGIYPDILQTFTDRGLIYSTENNGYHNAVFVGTDKDGTPRHAHIRGTTGQFKMNIESSDDRFAFHWIGMGEKIYVFEAPIDMLSYICLHSENWQENSYVAACGVSDKALMQCLKDNPHITKGVVCLDNDEKGLQFDRIIADRLKEQGYDCEIMIPTCKDWNEDLITSEGEEQCNLSM